MALEDHSLGNLLRMYLLKDRDVKFAGYKVPHPLEDQVELRLLTSDKKEQNPLVTLNNCITTILDDIEELEKQFDNQLKL